MGIEVTSDEQVFRRISVRQDLAALALQFLRSVNDTRMPAAKDQRLASWIFGGIAFAFLLGVFILAPRELPSYKQQILAIISAILCGLFGYFFTGSNKIVGDGQLPNWGKLSIQAGGGFALFALILLWWNSKSAPVQRAVGAEAPAVSNTFIVQGSNSGNQIFGSGNTQVITQNIQLTDKQAQDLGDRLAQAKNADRFDQPIDYRRIFAE